MKPIKILGAGLAGLTAAINLAKAGYEVAVFEQHDDVGKRFDGDLQGIENWSEQLDTRADFARMNLEINFDFDPSYELVVKNRVATERLHFERALFYLVKRGSGAGSLDQGLKRQALEAGVELHFGQTIPTSEADIIATGPNPRETFVIGKGVIFKSCPQTSAVTDAAIALIEPGRALTGYSYLLMVGGYGTICSVLFDDFPAIHRCYEQSRQVFDVMLPLGKLQMKKVGGVGCIALRNEWQQGPSLVVGEAAGLQDFLWAYGIRHALNSGYLAAHCIIHHQDYAVLARQNFESKLKASLVNR
ncbi:MAG: NAD(P)-binding protein, partial [Abitibacteriaceae bacterium]|nr:NAD(P)-binding protein [Abditibacteriaceae bacterium]